MSKRRETPLEQGSLRALYQYFLLPMVDYKPEDMPLKDWYASLFHLDYRDISLFTARTNFRLPGLFYSAPYVKIQGIGYREVKTGDQLYIRKDSRDEYYDVQFFGGPGEADQMFQLSLLEYGSIHLLLELTDGGISRKQKKSKATREANKLKKEARK